jgi:hypothetical protein
MNRQETIALWHECQEKRKKEWLGQEKPELEAQRQASEVWNTWARARIREREELVKLGKWQSTPTNARSLPKDGNAETKAWLETARVDFSGVFFRRASQDRMRRVAADEPADRSNLSAVALSPDEALSEGSAIDFRCFIFPGQVDFGLAVFEGWVWFGDTRFEGFTSFGSCDFQGWVGFKSNQIEPSSIFQGTVRFNDAHFADNAEFKGVEFQGAAAFNGCTFDGIATFDEAKFFEEASFVSISSPRGFQVKDTEFKNRVPNFTQAKFGEAPLIRRIKLPGALYNRVDRVPEDTEERYSALKRIAAQAQDHIAELDFFVEEIRARPWSRKNLFHKVLGKVYWMLCDYGKSVLRPFFWWFANIVAFNSIYLRISKDHAGKPCTWAQSDIPPSLYLAVANNFPFVGTSGATKREIALKCIGGDDLNTRWAELDAALVAQNTVAAILIFLFLLGLRNYFRIR